MVRIVVDRGVGSGASDVLTRLELEVLSKIRKNNGVDNPYSLVKMVFPCQDGFYLIPLSRWVSLVKMGFDTASAYVIVKNLIRKGFLEKDETGRIKPTLKALEANELVLVTREVRPTRTVEVRSTQRVDVPLRACKLGGGQIEATVASGPFNMTLPIWTGTPLWVRPSGGAPVTVTLRMAQGSWGVTRIQKIANDKTGPHTHIAD